MRAQVHEPAASSVDSPRSGYHSPSPSQARDHESSSSGEVELDSDSEVSVDGADDDDERAPGCAFVPDGETAASRLRLLVASEENRRCRTAADPDAEAHSHCQSHLHQYPGNIFILCLLAALPPSFNPLTPTVAI